MIRRAVWIIACLSCAGSIPVTGGQNEAEVALVYPCRPATRAIVIDGQLDPAEWSESVAVSGFLDSGSDRMFPEQVTMRLLYDEQYLYLGVRCEESNMKDLKTPTTDRDGAFWNDDALEFFLDTAHDHERYLQFAATAKAVRYDNQNGDSNWNCEWKAATQHLADAWTLEAAVPFAELKLNPPRVGALWGFNLCREREAGGKLELANWADVQRKFQSPPRFGHLYFITSDWKPSDPSLTTVAHDTGGKEARLFSNDGYWSIVPNAKPELLTYRSLLRGQEQGAVPQMEELRGIYRDRPQAVLHEDFKRLSDSFGEVESLIMGDSPVSADRFAFAKAFLANLGERVEALYWRVRLATLNETM
ncbi:MAG: hypothetical protein HY318_00755 [Armatimonadetes bacterium]|nr:hypothetical protein [Armatimonadota bacterium]